jgi:hypothetical protein
MLLNRDTLLKLDPETKAFALVGAFIGSFALLEEGINIAFGDVMGIKGTRRAIVCRNMEFDDKILALRALVDRYISDETEARRFDDLAKRASEFGTLKSRVVHTPFRPSPTSDGVQFFLMISGSKLKRPDMDWSIDDFLTHIANIHQTDSDLRAIDNRMTLRIAEALIRTD